MVAFAQSGTIDTTFGTDGAVTTAVHSNYNVSETTTVQLDGKILVAGKLEPHPHIIWLLRGILKMEH